MYLGIDIGGTKTLVAIFSDDGMLRQKVKFPTDHDYGKFLDNVRSAREGLDAKDFVAGGVGTPGELDREHGRAIRFGNLPWTNVSIQSDLEEIFNCSFAMENDAKMAGLSEAMLLKDYRSVLYVTISTGIGTALVVDNKIDINVGDRGGRAILLENDGKIMPWEDFAGGRAIAETYGKKAQDITDEETWLQITRNLAKGFIHLIAIMEPDVIVIGGSVGTYFDRFGKLLAQQIKKYDMPMVELPELRGARRPEEAVIYGCYDLAKQTFGHAARNQ
jgi:predicted NBD/HSP70 family sugar kinase